MDLTTGRIEKEALPARFIEDNIGGRGMASRVLYDEVPPETDPYSPENRLIFCPGALHGTGVPAASRTTVASKSPLTGMHGDGHAGATWGGELKRAGYDLLIVQGQAEKPVYLHIHDDRVELRDAGDFWGLLTSQTHSRIGR